MNRFLSKNLIPLLFPVIVMGCTVAERLMHGDIQGAAVEGGTAVVTAGVRTVVKLAQNTDEVNVSQEYYIGRGVAGNVFMKYKRLDDPALNRYVRLVGDNVAKASTGVEVKDGKQPYKGYFFAIVDDNQVNAFSAPGGFIFITKGALRAMQTEDELACVLGHEIGHVIDRHGVKYVLKQKNFSIPFETAAEEVAARSPELIGNLAKQFGGMCGDLAKKAAGGMGTEYEDLADRMGAKFAARAGYNPKSMIEFLSRTHHGEDIKE